MQLVIKDLTKTYTNGTQALRQVSLTIYQGMFGLLGPNGAGKSTLMRTLATLQEADSGSAMLDDLNILQQQEDVRKILGYLPQEFGLYPRVSALNLLDYLACLKGIASKTERKDQVETLLHRTNLWAARHENLGTFSGGMKQRFGIAQALLANPKLIIVDEPTAGLDPAERYRFLNLLSEIGEDTIIILSTHIVEDVKELCTQMGIIMNGRVIYQGRPTEAIEKLRGKIWMKRVANADLQHIREKHVVVFDRLLGGTREIHVLSDTQPDPSFDQAPIGLEDVYFSHIHQELTHQ